MNRFVVARSVTLFTFVLPTFWEVVVAVGAALVAIITFLLAVAVFTLYERKVLASVQRRRGPNSVGIWGFLQPIADAVKLLVKEYILPKRARPSFSFAPIFIFLAALVVWSIIPISPLTSSVVSVNISLLFFLAFSSLGVYGIIVAGWASGSRYPLLGAQRSVAQLISYEIAFGLLLIPPILFSQSISFVDVVAFQHYATWFGIIFLPLFLAMITISLAETNRTPFDLPEAEAELVAGFNVEYSSISFAFFFLAEYGNMITMSIFMSLIFTGGWGGLNETLTSFGQTDLANLLDLAQIKFIISIVVFMTIFILIRGGLPRYRYDQLMRNFWKYWLLAILSIVIAAACFFLGYGGHRTGNAWEAQVYQLMCYELSLFDSTLDVTVGPLLRTLTTDELLNMFGLEKGLLWSPLMWPTLFKNIPLMPIPASVFDDLCLRVGGFQNLMWGEIETSPAVFNELYKQLTELLELRIRGYMHLVHPLQNLYSTVFCLDRWFGPQAAIAAFAEALQVTHPWMSDGECFTDAIEFYWSADYQCYRAIWPRSLLFMVEHWNAGKYMLWWHLECPECPLQSEIFRYTRWFIYPPQEIFETYPLRTAIKNNYMLDILKGVFPAEEFLVFYNIWSVVWFFVILAYTLVVLKFAYTLLKLQRFK